MCKPLQEVETEARAAVIIQNYYRRYKQASMFTSFISLYICNKIFFLNRRYCYFDCFEQTFVYSTVTGSVWQRLLWWSKRNIATTASTRGLRRARRRPHASRPTTGITDSYRPPQQQQVRAVAPHTWIKMEKSLHLQILDLSRFFLLKKMLKKMFFSWGFALNIEN